MSDQAEVMRKVAKKWNRIRWQDPTYRKGMLQILKSVKRKRQAGYRRTLEANRPLFSRLMAEKVKVWRQDPAYIEMVGRSHIRPSKPQISIFKSLCARGFRGQRLEYFVKSYFIDIAFPARKIAVEVDGSYWHSLPEHKRSNRTKDRKLKRLGWRIIRVDANLNEAPRLEKILRHVKR